jgi:hypothetical protein
VDSLALCDLLIDRWYDSDGDPTTAIPPVINVDLVAEYEPFRKTIPLGLQHARPFPMDEGRIRLLPPTLEALPLPPLGSTRNRVSGRVLSSPRPPGPGDLTRALIATLSPRAAWLTELQHKNRLPRQVRRGERDRLTVIAWACGAPRVAQLAGEVGGARWTLRGAADTL